MNRRREHVLRLTTLVLLGALASGCASTSHPTVDEIVASNLEARGGSERIKALSSIRETGTVSGPGGRVARVTREMKRPGLFRLEFAYQGTTSVFAHDGTNAWQVAPLQGQFEPTTIPVDVDAATGTDQRDIEGPLVDWKRKGHGVTVVGRESIDGSPVYKLEVALKGGGIRHEYVDVASRLVVRSDVLRLVRGRITVLQNTFSDFREIDGHVLPHLIETRVQDRPQVLTIRIETIELNADLDDARFQMPR